MTASKIDPTTATARGIASAVRSGSLTAEAVTAAYLDRIADVDGPIRAWVHLDGNRALAEARERDRAGLAESPLAGVPLAVKDVIDSADMPTEYGSAIYPGHRPGRDASCLHLARWAGAVALGKTVTTEFATMSPGPTANPFSAGHTPGGSSSGSAAALGAAMTLLGFGTQTSGSTIRPAAFCGVVGYKASLGLIDRTGVKPLSESLDVVGIMARDVRDAALFASVIARDHDLIVGEEAPTLPRVGLFLPAQAGEPADADAVAALERTATAIGRVGTVTTPGWWDGLGPAQDAVFGWEASAALAYERDCHFETMSEISRGFTTRQAASTQEGWREGLAARDAALARLDDLFGDNDILLSPPASGTAPSGLGSTGNAAFNIRWTLLGIPTITVPAGLGANGLPVGVQIAARPGHDRLLLHAAAAIEDALRKAGHPARPVLAQS